MNAVMTFGRNMVVLRDRDELTIINSVRLTPDAEAGLDGLGRVRHVMRPGFFHGRDDRYYVERYAADFWAPLAARANPGPTVTRMLTEHAELPVPGLRVFLFRQTRHAEVALLLEREGGILITCDALQYYADRKFCSPLARIAMPLLGFKLRLIIGPQWLKAMTPGGSTLLPDYERLLELEFRHLIGGHGSLLRDSAHAAVRDAVRATFPGG
jgi:hypothetical protein